ncbi:MAG: D-inositol-3-phosphate glycosyltransferase [Prosthecobacter sp.]|nr:D-inositol-3-phosphate glycosyltransferase [Prosthecobacter sp.]
MKRRPRLTFLIRDLGHGGAQRQMVTLAKALAADGRFDVSVVHFYPGAFESELRAAAVPTVCVGKRHRWDLAGFFWRLVKAVRQLRPDILHGYLHESNLMALLLKPWCGWPRVVWGIRDSRTDADTWGLLGRLSFRLNCLFSGAADLIIANSRAGRSYYVAQGYPEQGFEVVPNGMDVQRFQPRPGRHADKPGALRFAMVGRLHPMKDHATFLRALAEVPDAFGVVMGDGDAGQVQELRQLAESLGVASRLEWRAAESDLASVYPGFDCLVSASAYGEGFSNVVGEAMACGLPVIVSDVGDSAWLLGESSWVFPAGDHASLAARMRHLAAMPAERRVVLGQDNRRRIEENFALARMVERTAVMLDQSLGKAGPVRRILWITTGLGTGGAEMMLTQVIAGLPHLSHQVISLTAGGKHVEPLKAAGAGVHSLDMPAGRPTLSALLRLLRLAWAPRPDVVMGWMYHGCLAAVLVKLFRLGQGRVVWNIRQSLYDLALEKPGSARVIRLLARLAPLAEVITYNSQVSARQHEAVGYPAGKTLLIPNGFDLSRWRPLADEARFVFPGRGGHGGRLFVGRFGRYSAMKDYPTFLDAAALMVKELPEVEFVLVGTGVDGSNNELIGKVEELGLQKHVHLLGERQDLPLLTASLDLAVSSSAFGEGFPNVVGEAMACSVPVVATDIGDTAWVMGDSGTLVPARDPARLADACLAVLKLPRVERLRRGAEGRRRIEECFSLAAVLGRFDALLQAPD